ncbi:hypothetical protein [Mesorhizobium sp. M2D.F.Ca.ET.223.01.1.1]|uniref:hypothetical protein n=1 Tax=Mesorhizobium sp. M2D.F.Ca.ET.223.01.1.1 TaxID=2563940 RepID=UPI001FDFDB77|nr:hypothetical protein [Mesorhizobium sp. M2D.F.Ca.ET.223.01.1.1]
MARDVARVVAGGERFEDAHNDSGFVGLDDQFARLARNRRIAIGPPASVAPFANYARHAAPDLVRKVL